MESIQGKHFSITEPLNVNTVIYRINETDKSLLEKAPKFTIERLISTTDNNSGGSKKTFFIDEPSEKGEDLLILSFANERVVVNMGVLEGNKITISKKPVPIKFNTLYYEKETEYKEFRYTPNLKRPISIIDPDTTEEVKPILYLDQETDEVKGKCKLQPYKSYFAFEIREDID